MPFDENMKLTKYILGIIVRRQVIFVIGGDLSRYRLQHVRLVPICGHMKLFFFLLHLCIYIAARRNAQYLTNFVFTGSEVI